jgi:hypothetical protein
MCFDSARVGAIEITSLPGEILACSGTTEIMLVVSDRIPHTQQIRHVLIRASRFGDVSATHLNAKVGLSQNVRFEFDEHLLRIGGELTVFDLKSGRVLAVEALWRRRHIGGRFFYGDDAVWVVVYANGSIQWHKLGGTGFEPVFAVQGAHGFPMIYSKNFSEVQVIDGEYNVTRTSGAFIDADGQPKVLLRHPNDLSTIVELEQVKKSLTTESSIAIHDQVRQWLKLDYLKISKVADSYAAALYGLDHRTAKLVTTQSVRSRMQGIAVVDGCVVLFRKASLGFAFEIAASPRRIVLRQFNSASQYSIVNFDHEFRVENSPFRHQWTLKKAVLPQGIAWLDSRGLLHLRARDGSELSLVLHDDHVSGWHSDGSVFGTQYFINRPESPVPASVEAWLKGFANQCSN